MTVHDLRILAKRHGFRLVPILPGVHVTGAGVRLRKQVLGVLRCCGSQTTAQLGKRVGRTAKSLRYHLDRLETDDLIESVLTPGGRGCRLERRWALVETG